MSDRDFLSHGVVGVLLLTVTALAVYSLWDTAIARWF